MAELMHFELRGLDVVQRAWAQAPEVVDDEIRRFLLWATSHLQAEVADRTPTTFGQLRGSILGTVDATPSGLLGVVGTSLDYAPAVELGTKPHFMGRKGIDALTEWVKQKIPLGQAVSAKTGRPLKTPGIDQAARGVAFAIARKIAKHGTKGAFMFLNAFNANKALVEDRFDQTVATIASRLQGTS